MSVLVKIRDWWHAPVTERLDRINGRLKQPEISISEQPEIFGRITRSMPGRITRYR